MRVSKASAVTGSASISASKTARDDGTSSHSETIESPAGAHRPSGASQSTAPRLPVTCAKVRTRSWAVAGPSGSSAAPTSARTARVAFTAFPPDCSRSAAAAGGHIGALARRRSSERASSVRETTVPSSPACSSASSWKTCATWPISAVSLPNGEWTRSASSVRAQLPEVDRDRGLGHDLDQRTGEELTRRIPVQLSGHDVQEVGVDDRVVAPVRQPTHRLEQVVDVRVRVPGTERAQQWLEGVQAAPRSRSTCARARRRAIATIRRSTGAAGGDSCAVARSTKPPTRPCSLLSPSRARRGSGQRSRSARRGHRIAGDVALRETGDGDTQLQADSLHGVRVAAELVDRAGRCRVRPSTRAARSGSVAAST